MKKKIKKKLSPVNWAVPDLLLSSLRQTPKCWNGPAERCGTAWARLASLFHVPAQAPTFCWHLPTFGCAFWSIWTLEAVGERSIITPVWTASQKNIKPKTAHLILELHHLLLVLFKLCWRERDHFLQLLFQHRFAIGHNLQLSLQSGHLLLGGKAK